ncbi:hypothetical protein ABS772_13795 [Methylorubrum podarium]|uniref:Uncharacterized protein n=1 Tax=Methylorubrum podarium TaxID=200476 RepID=A0ABV1QNN4_9HYPH
MSGTVLTFPRNESRIDRPRPAALLGGDVFILDTEDGCFGVFDESPSGGSAGCHGYFEDHAEAIARGREIAERINARSFADLSKGGA